MYSWALDCLIEPMSRITIRITYLVSDNPILSDMFVIATDPEKVKGKIPENQQWKGPQKD
jgi:hypothetical protein